MQFNYVTLLTTVLSTLKREQDIDLQQLIPYYIGMVESEVNRRAQVTEMEAWVNTSPPEDETQYIFSWPADYNGLRAINIRSEDSYIQNIELVSPENFTSLAEQLCNTAQGVGIAGRPRRTKWVYSMENACYKINPPVSSNQTVELLYWGKVPPLGEKLPDTSTRGTNWLLEKYPDIYLYGTLKHCSPYIKNDERIAVWKEFYEEGIAGLELHNDKVVWSGTTPRVRTRGAI